MIELQEIMPERQDAQWFCPTPRGGIAAPFIRGVGLFSHDECAAIAPLASAEAVRPTLLRTGSLEPDVSLALSRRYRSGGEVRVPCEPRHAWIYDRLSSAVACASAFFRIEADEGQEQLRLYRYAENDHFQTWHMDTGYEAGAGRKLSVSVELSDPSDYDGGDLDIFPHIGGAARPRGSITIFPSFRLHRVTPITRGVRIAMVAFFRGRPFQ